MRRREGLLKQNMSRGMKRNCPFSKGNLRINMSVLENWQNIFLECLISNMLTQFPEFHVIDDYYTIAGIRFSDL